MMRVTHNMLNVRTMNNVNRNSAALSNIQEKMSSGKAVLRISENAIKANSAIRYDRVIERNEQYEDNIDLGESMLGLSDSVVGDLHILLNSASALALDAVDSGADEQTRKANAAELESITQQVLATSNRQFREKYLFGGTATDRVPYANDGNGVKYYGNDREYELEINEGDKISINSPGSAVFGGLNTAVDNAKDLDSDIVWETKLEDLNSGHGVTPGSIKVIMQKSNPTGPGLLPVPPNSNLESVTIDLSSASTLQDVKDLIEYNTRDTTGSSPPENLEVGIDTGTNGIFVECSNNGAVGKKFYIEEIGNGTTGQELGILKPATVPLNNADTVSKDLNPDLSLTTKLTTINGGTGLTTNGGLDDGFAGFIISNGNKSHTFSRAEMMSMDTMGDLVNAINSQDLDVVASINKKDNSLKIESNVSGPILKIIENGGTTAAELGIESFTDKGLLRNINNGRGWDAGAVSVTTGDGVNTVVDLSNATTINDILVALNGSDANITASLNKTTGGIDIVDNTGGAGDMVIGETNGLPTASTLGIAGTSVDGTITGEDMQYGLRANNLFTALSDITDGMYSDDRSLMERGHRDLQEALGTILGARADLGTRSVRVANTKDRVIDERMTTTKLLSEIVDLNYADAALEYQGLMNTFEAGMRAAGQVQRLSLLDFI